MGLSEALLNEGKSLEVIEKKITIMRKKFVKMDTDISQLRKDCVKAGADPDDWSIGASFAIDDLNGILDKAQELVDMFK